MSTIDEVLTFDEAAALLKCSVRTIERMATANPPALEQRGKGRLRRITGRSIQAYINGDVTWDGSRAQEPNRSLRAGTNECVQPFRVVIQAKMPQGRRKP